MSDTPTPEIPRTGGAHLRRRGLVGLQVPLAPQDRDMIARVAEAAGQPMTRWCAERLLAAARREERKLADSE